MSELGYSMMFGEVDKDFFLKQIKGRGYVDTGTSGIDFNKARVHTTESLKSKVFVTFIAMIVRNELFQKAEALRKKNRKAYTVPGMMSELENIECTRNSVGKYRRKYALTAKQKLILKQFDMDEKYIDRSIGEFSYQCFFYF